MSCDRPRPKNASITRFFDELFHEDHENPVQHIVVLDPDRPSPYLREVLDSDAFARKVTFVQGSPLQKRDLDRCRLARVAGIMVLANQFSSKPADDDANYMLAAMAVKRYSLWVHPCVCGEHEQ